MVSPRLAPVRALLVILVVAAAAGAVATATAPGTPIEARSIRQSLFGTCFTNDHEAWIVGDLGRVLHTTDGGDTWRREDAATKRPFLAIDCVGPGTAWIAGKEGIVSTTSDGGATWRSVETGSARHLFALRFANKHRGHAVGDFGTMIHTEDGGESWTVDRVPDHVELPEMAIDMGVEPGDVNLYALSYGDDDHAWIAGEFGTIMASQNGGVSWVQQRPPFETTLFGIQFLDARRGWAVGIDSVILRTVDGGRTWEVQQAPVQQRSFYDVRIQGRHGWIVGDSGTVLRSNDGGESWTLHPLPIELAANWIRSVWLTPAGSGLAVGADGLIFRLDGERFERLGATALRDDS